MNVAQLQLVLGRLSSPAATEKPDLAGYEAQGEFLGWVGRGEVGEPLRVCGVRVVLGPWDSARLLGALPGGGLCPREN